MSVARALLAEVRSDPEARRELVQLLCADEDGLRALADALANATGSAADWLDSRGAAAHLGLAEGTVRRLAAANQLPSVQDGPRCRRYFSRAELDRWRANGGAPGHLRLVK